MFYWATKEAIAQKVYRLVIGTHSPEIHEEIVRRFQDWIVIYDLPYTPDKQLGTWGRNESLKLGSSTLYCYNLIEVTLNPKP